MRIIQCAVIVGAFAVITQASPRPWPQQQPIVPGVWDPHRPEEHVGQQSVSTIPPTTVSQSLSPTQPSVQSTNSSTTRTITSYNSTTTTTAIPHSSLRPTTQRPQVSSSAPQGSLQGFNRPHPCGHIPSPGECQAAFPRYYYNKETSQCDCYLFGGCDEDVGSYQTLKECHEKCSPMLGEEGPTCKLVYIDNFSLYSPSTTTSTPVTRTPSVGTRPVTQPSLIPHGQPTPTSPSNENPSSGFPVTDRNPVTSKPFETSQAGAGPVSSADNANKPTPTRTPFTSIGIPSVTNRPVHGQSNLTSPLNENPSSGSPDRDRIPVTNMPLETSQAGAGPVFPTSNENKPTPTHTPFTSISIPSVNKPVHGQSNLIFPSNENPSVGFPVMDRIPVTNKPFETNRPGAGPVSSVGNRQPFPNSPSNGNPPFGSPVRDRIPVTKMPSEANRPGAGHDFPTQTNPSLTEIYNRYNEGYYSSSQGSDEHSYYYP